MAAVVKMHERGSAILTGVRSAVLQMPRPTKLNDFSVANLWEAMGVGKEMGERRHAGAPKAADVAPAQSSAEVDVVDAEIVDGEPGDTTGEPDMTQAWVDAIHGAGDRDQLMAVWRDAQSKGAHQNPGIRAAFAQRGQDLKAAA